MSDIMSRVFSQPQFLIGLGFASARLSDGQFRLGIVDLFFGFLVALLIVLWTLAHEPC